MTRSHHFTATVHKAGTRPTYKHLKMAPETLRPFSHCHQSLAVSAEQRLKARWIQISVTVLSKKSKMMITQFPGMMELRRTPRNKPVHPSDSMKNFWINKQEKAH